MDKSRALKSIEREAIFGTLPVLTKEKQYGFWDAFLVLSGYAVATWCYTQGIFMSTLVNIKQLAITDFAVNILMLLVYLLPIMFACKYGIDMWIWLKSVFGTNGIKVIIILIGIVNFPWFGVCADIFASSIMNLFGAFGITLPEWSYKPWGFLCIIAGSIIAISGPNAIKWTMRLIVPALLAVGVVVIVLGFTAVPFNEIMAYEPDVSMFSSKLEPYMCTVEAGFGFALSWSCSTAVIPRLCRKERDGYWATVSAYGIVAPLFVFAGGVLGVATFIKFGVMGDDITLMLAQIGGPILALLSLVLVAFANIGTHGTGAYIWSVVIKSAFPKAKYWVLVVIFGAYTGLIVVWGQIIEYFGAMITISAFIYGPIMAMLLMDYFVVRKKKISLRSGYELKNHDKYKFTGGFNLVGFICLIAGTVIALLVFDPINYVGRSELFCYTTGTGLGFVLTCALYWICYKIPAINKYMLKDRDEVTV